MHLFMNLDCKSQDDKIAVQVEWNCGKTGRLDSVRISLKDQKQVSEFEADYLICHGYANKTFNVNMYLVHGIVWHSVNSGDCVEE